LAERIKDEGKREALRKEEEFRESLIKKGQAGYPCGQLKNSEGVILDKTRPACSAGYCCGGASNEKKPDDKDYVGVETC